MLFADHVELKTASLRQSILQHPFITGIGDGTINIEKFKFYIRQDYLYLTGYSRVLSIACARSPDLRTMSWFAQLVHETLTKEMQLHRNYSAALGVSENDLQATKAAPAALAYINFLLTTAFHHDYAELVAALLPCQWGYWEIGNHLLRKGPPSKSPLLNQWIHMYASEEFKALGRWLRDLSNQLGNTDNAQKVARMEHAYLTSLRYEYLFWDMSYNEESWPV